MKAFLWHLCKRVSDNYHENGSVLIEAATIERARELAVIETKEPVWDEKKVQIRKGEMVFDEIQKVLKEYRTVKIPMLGPEKEPAAVFTSKSKKEMVWVFPDAGCC